MCFTCWLRSGFSHFMNIDSLSFTWYFSSSRVQDLEAVRCAGCSARLWTLQKSKKRSKTCRKVSAHALKWRNVGWFHQHNKHYNLHTKIFKTHGCEAPHAGTVSFTFKKIFILKVVKTSLISTGLHNWLASLRILLCAVTEKCPT